MSFSNHGRFGEQVRFLRRQFLQDGELPFTDVLSEGTIAQTLQALNVVWLDRIYSPLVTLWVFLSQVLSQDHSCRAAVARLVAYRVSRGRRRCSAETGAYCQARKRLPEKFFSGVARLVGKNLDDQVDSAWLWKGRPVYMFDGTTVSMPDTPENQAAYPQVYNQRPGLGFPIARICTIMSLSCGAVLDLGISRYAGKGQGELSLLRKLWDILSPGDILLTDALMSTWYELLTLKERGVDSVSRLNKATRRADFRRGKRLGEGDHIVRWRKPSPIRSLDWTTYKNLPDYLEVRETRVRVEQPGFRTKVIIVVTTLLDPEATTKEDLASLYRSRWSQELDIRDIKISLQMDVLRCKTPELVRKEIWTHILAYNLIRTIMAQAASQQEILPREISFKGTMQALEAFQPLISFQGHRGKSFRQQLYLQLLEVIATHRVADRPDRFEPRMRKRYPRKAIMMTKPRRELKRLMRKGVAII
ncbi:IS4 family transposase [Aeoliella sp. ICT_H6.2]|uniref:IS4 family transposase n=1 Tax=Aeoliella straminimaris TaxID=2954799 RepID=A0A9X2FHH7_9BACT|nr:IS4 family transposase [Aeoliella straminimaris]MCO6044941.1 IS4 family transposase [Aeoliella straminimaris]